MTLQTHRPQSGWTGDVRQARTKTYTGIRLRRWHTSLAQGTRPCATIWYASSPSHAVHKINHSAPPASQQSLHTDLDHAIAACFTRIGHVRFHMKKPDLRRGWGAPAWDAHRKQREAHHTPPITRCINDERSGEAKGRRAKRDPGEGWSPHRRLDGPNARERSGAGCPTRPVNSGAHGGGAHGGT